jgi:transcription initiation factor TFIIA small subunit
MAFYRKTTLGLALTESLDELVSSGNISQPLSEAILKQFDQSFRQAFPEKVSTQPVKFRYKVDSYRFLDHVWTFQLANATFHIGADSVQTDKLKVVATDDEKVGI